MDEGIFIKMNRTLGGFSREVFVLSKDDAVNEILREVKHYLQHFSDTFIHGDLSIDEERCQIWNPSKPLGKKVNIVLAETWRGSGTCWAFACRNKTEIKEAIRHAMNHEDFDNMKVEIHRDVAVLHINEDVERKGRKVDVTARIKALEKHV